MLAGPSDEMEAELLGCLVDGSESTDLIVSMLARDGLTTDAAEVERWMYELERGGLVTGERSQHHLIGGRTDWWWRLTERAWLKLAASGEYSDGDHDPLSSDYPPIARAVAHVVRTNPRTSAEIIDALLAGGGKLPPDDETIWPHFSGRPNRSADGHRAALGDLVERRIGHLVLNGVLQPTSEDQSPVRWALTDSGRTQLGA